MGDSKQMMGGTAIKPVGWDRTFCESLQYMIYDPANGTILTRTPLSWLKIIVFYCIYYTFLAGFWLGCLNIFFMTLPEGRPKWEQDASIIGSNPGVGLRPKQTDAMIDSAMFVLKAGDEDMRPTNMGKPDEGEGDKNIDYAVRMQKYLKKYEDTEGLRDCEENVINKDSQGCIFDMATLDECAEFPYGYVANKSIQSFAEPCIFLKFNKIFNWEPTPINPENLEDEAYDKMSVTLKNKIKKSSDHNMVWIDCFGRYAADKEAFQFEYYPQNQGIPVKYFPFKGGNYQPPLIALKFTENKAAWGQLQHIECRAWFDGVHHDTKDKAGLVQFEMHMLASDGRA